MPRSVRNSQSLGWLFVLAIILIVVLTGYSRISAPWAMPVVGDEMHHLESWRNRYRTDDIYPLFIRRIEAKGLLEGEPLELIKSAYRASPLIQRALIVLVDPQPPTFPVMAELIEAATHSSLIALRLPSVIASIVSVILMYLVGRELADRTLGLWLAALLCIDLQAQIYAGVGRPYALGQCAVLLTIWTFLREQRGEFPTPRRFLLAALFAQSVQWFAWAIVGPMVVIELIRRWRGGTPIGRLIRQTWWYALLSFMLLGLMGVQLLNPTVSGQADMREPQFLWYFFSWASPFAAIDPLVGHDYFAVISPAGLILAFLIGAGVLALLVDREFFERFPSAAAGRAPVVIALAAMFLAAILSLVFIGSSARFMMTYLIVPIIVAGIGARWVFRAPTLSHAAVAMMVAGFLVIGVAWPEHPHKRIFSSDIDYAWAAKRVQEELGPNGTWVAFPYHYGNCLYRYADLPEPAMPDNRRHMREMLQTLPRKEGPIVVFTRWNVYRAEKTLWAAEHHWDMGARYIMLRFKSDQEKSAPFRR